MKNNLKIIYTCSVFMTLGAASFYLLHKKEFRDLVRTPASEPACVELVSNFLRKDSTDSMENRLRAFFSQLENYGWNEELMKEKVARSYDRGFTISGKIDDRVEYITTAEILFKKMQAGDPSSKFLLELGYTIHNDRLNPPTDFVLFYSKLYKLLLASAAENGVDEKDIIYPSFLFIKDRKEPKFIRPGIDPLPSREDGWVLNKGYQLDDYHFSLMISEKKMLLGPDIFEHDIGHILDLIQRPKYSVAYRIYHEKKFQFLKDKLKDEYEAAQKYKRAITGMDMDKYFNEFINMPDFKNYKKIKQLIPSLNTDKLRTRDQVLTFYRKMNSEELLGNAKKYIKNKFTLFSDHGGGSRDGNLARSVSEAEIWASFDAVAKGEYSFEAGHKISLDRSLGDHKLIEEKTLSLTEDEYYRLLEAPAIYDRLQFLVDFRAGKKIPLKIEKYFKLVAEEKKISVNEYADYAIAYSLSELELKLQTAIHFKVTPEQIALDTSKLYDVNGAAAYRKTATYAYYSTYPKDSPQWVRAVQIANED